MSIGILSSLFVLRESDELCIEQFQKKTVANNVPVRVNYAANRKWDGRIFFSFLVEG